MKITLFFILFFLMNALKGGELPTLIEMVILGDREKPFFDQTVLQLEVGKEYLLRIDNGKSFSVTLYYDSFGKKVATYYLQGVPSVSQESLDIPANSKALWHLTPLECGAFYFMPVTSESEREKGKKVKINVVKTLENEAEETSSEEWVPTPIKRKFNLFQKRSK